MDGWNTTFLLGRPIFRGELLVSGSVIHWTRYMPWGSKDIWQMVPHIVGAGVIGAWTAGNVGGRDMGMEYQFVHFLAS